MEEFIWWAIPFEVVLVLGALTWSSTHALDPEKLLTSAQPPLTVQVVALPWKWLFIYPEEGIASVNELTIPTNRPVTFQITADAPMNSFWIPALGGQMYAMTGMTTNLNLMASESGTYVGKSANYSGEGFAHMNFAVRAVSPNEFATWVTQTRTAPASLTETSYRALAAPGEVDGVRYYGSIMIPFAEIVHRSMQMMR
jgi:cytochrome o ubiquinol oxidase subunit 2